MIISRFTKKWSLLTLSLMLLPLFAIAQTTAKIAMPKYSRQINPTCTCDCENKIIYQPMQVTYRSLVQWTREAATSAYTYGFGNYQTALSKASQYFTPNGWHSFTSALVDSKNLELVLQKHLIVSAIAISDPTSIKQQDIKGKTGWKITIPILAKYENEESTTRKPLLVTMSIVQTAENGGIQGLGIDQFVVEPAEES